VDAWVAGILAGGSPLGRPEGSVHLGDSIFVALTAHTGIEAGDPFAPPVDVAEGCILQLSEEEGPDFRWQLHSSAGESFANPDNLGVDPSGALLLCTDSEILEPYGHNSLCRFAGGAWERLVVAPPEAELCGPSYATDGALFLSVQHPAERWGESTAICVW
jgi:secreted PhoX family phosphatase